MADRVRSVVEFQLVLDGSTGISVNATGAASGVSALHNASVTATKL